MAKLYLHSASHVKQLCVLKTLLDPSRSQRQVVGLFFMSFTPYWPDRRCLMFDLASKWNWSKQTNRRWTLAQNKQPSRSQWSCDFGRCVPDQMFLFFLARDVFKCEIHYVTKSMRTLDHHRHRSLLNIRFPSQLHCFLLGGRSSIIWASKIRFVFVQVSYKSITLEVRNWC